jgi:hypothetical protein
MNMLAQRRAGRLRETLSFPGYKLHEDALTGEFSLYPLSTTGGRRCLRVHVLATLSGTGRLHSSTGEVGAVRYHLPVRQAHGTQVGEGFIWGDEDLLHETYMDSEHTLQISDGRRISILLTDLNSNGAEFRTTGPIPGFENSFAQARAGVMV